MDYIKKGGKGGFKLGIWLHLETCLVSVFASNAPASLNCIRANSTADWGDAVRCMQLEYFSQFKQNRLSPRECSQLWTIKSYAENTLTMTMWKLPRYPCQTISCQNPPFVTCGWFLNNNPALTQMRKRSEARHFKSSGFFFIHLFNLKCTLILPFVFPVPILLHPPSFNLWWTQKDRIW